MGINPAIGGREVLFEWASCRALRRLVTVAARVVLPKDGFSEIGKYEYGVKRAMQICKYLNQEFQKPRRGIYY